MLLKTVDVAIGVVFLYLLLTFTASALLEVISMARNWRPKILHDTIANMLKGSDLLNVDEVYTNPLVIGLGRDGAAISWVDVLEHLGWRATKIGTPPSYMPPATFSAVVLEGLMKKPISANDLSPDGVIKTVSDLVAAQKGSDALLSVLRTTLATQGSSIQALRLAIEKWFNDTMDRASGLYKRRTQSFLLLFGLLFAFGGNVDTIAVGRWLWQGDAARQAVLAVATDYAKQNNAPPAGTQRAGDSSLELDTFVTNVARLDRNIIDLQYPIGWGARWTETQQTTFSWPQYLLGALLTAIAISMGSTFWFDALQNLIKIRGTGPKPISR